MEKYPKNMAAVVLLSLLILGCLANHAQCSRLAALGGEKDITFPRGTCYHSTPIGRIGCKGCWCCWDDLSCYPSEDECKKSCPP
ncbi:hypothetical protein EJB05_22848 [Eragrostis curvula]|uniref:Meg domain-containing protein n=1 Tax=Eragrostis curvula TaxID=38414 RepID=A0A5J9V5E9_9POAL|nr:hypothetical protein EJB05_22848 [Eragrostis curvula]